jgi:hypothetical protein
MTDVGLSLPFRGPMAFTYGPQGVPFKKASFPQPVKPVTLQKKRTSEAEALVSPALCGTAEAVASAKLSILRVITRRLQGGHDVPEEKLRQRDVLPLCAHARVSCQPVTSRENLRFDSFGGVPVIFCNGPPDGVKVFDSLRRQLK